MGVAPALALLLTVAFWTDLAGAAVYIGKGYTNWLRYGSKGPDN